MAVAWNVPFVMSPAIRQQSQVLVTALMHYFKRHDLAHCYAALLHHYLENCTEAVWKHTIPPVRTPHPNGVLHGDGPGQPQANENSCDVVHTSQRYHSAIKVALSALFTVMHHIFKEWCAAVGRLARCVTAAVVAALGRLARRVAAASNYQVMLPLPAIMANRIWRMLQLCQAPDPSSPTGKTPAGAENIAARKAREACEAAAVPSSDPTGCLQRGTCLSSSASGWYGSTTKAGTLAFTASAASSSAIVAKRKCQNQLADPHPRTACDIGYVHWCRTYAREADFIMLLGVATFTFGCGTRMLLHYFTPEGVHISPGYAQRTYLSMLAYFASCARSRLSCPVRNSALE
ncbi:MAG: hypothetical protein MUF14_09545 [Hyphomonadaceae bacterium]|nr:hypothetical protein [Hyphomonadaceae bacterium]